MQKNLVKLSYLAQKVLQRGRVPVLQLVDLPSMLTQNNGRKMPIFVTPCILPSHTGFKNIFRYQSYFLLLLAFFMTFSLLQFLSKKCYQSGHQRAPWLLSSRLMSIFAITSHQYTITLYTPGHLQISWDVFAKKSADILSFRNSFITISRGNHPYCRNK